MSDVTYRIVEHDGGWAYKLGDVFSETFASRGEAEAAADRVATEQRVPGDDAAISWQDEKGTWHDEFEAGNDRPAAFVEKDWAPLSSPHVQDAQQAATLPLNLVERFPLGSIVLAAAVGYLLAMSFRSRR